MTNATSISMPSMRKGFSNLVSIFITGLIVLGVIALGVFYVEHRKNNEDKKALANAIINKETFSPKGYENYLSRTGSELASTELTKGTRDAIELKRAMVMIDAVEPDETKRNQLRVDAGNLLKKLYDGSSQDKEGADLRGKVILAYMLDFNQRFFLNGNTRLLPDIYKAPYMELYMASSTKKITREEYERLAFKTFFGLAHNPASGDLAQDRTFVSNRMYLTAAYIDSFYDALSDSERKALVAALGSDLALYDSTYNISFFDPLHTKLVADYYRAVALDVYTKKAQATSTQVLAAVAENYDRARKNIDTTDPIFALTNRTQGSYLDAYYAAFLNRTKPEGYKAKLSEVIKEMNDFAADGTVENNMVRYYADLSSRATWNGVRMDLLALKKDSKDYAMYLQMLGATLK